MAVIVHDEEVQGMLTWAGLVLGPAGIGLILKGGVVQYLQGEVRERFDKQGDKVSGPWAELSPATQNYRLMQGFNPTWPINVRFGDMRAWAEHNAGRIVPSGDMTLLTFPGEASGSLEEKLTAAQKGTSGGKKFPARPIVSLGAADLAPILAIMEGNLIAMLTGGRSVRVP